MSGILIMSYKLKELTNVHVYIVFELCSIVYISANKCLIGMGLKLKKTVLNMEK